MKKQTDELVDAIVKGIQDKKGRRIVVADLTHIPDTICQKFVICSGGSPVQVQASLSVYSPHQTMVYQPPVM